jgi:hypothetical protein
LGDKKAILAPLFGFERRRKPPLAANEPNQQFSEKNCLLSLQMCLFYADAEKDIAAAFQCRNPIC